MRCSSKVGKILSILSSYYTCLILFLPLPNTVFVVHFCVSFAAEPSKQDARVSNERMRPQLKIIKDQCHDMIASVLVWLQAQGFNFRLKKMESSIEEKAVHCQSFSLLRPTVSL